MSEVRSLLTRIIAANEVSHTRLSQITGISQSMISGMVRGSIKVPLQAAVDLKNAFVGFNKVMYKDLHIELITAQHKDSLVDQLSRLEDLDNV